MPNIIWLLNWFRLMGEFGITVTSTRAALRRVASRGLLVSSRNGRTTAYGLPPRASDVIVTHMRRLRLGRLFDAVWVSPHDRTDDVVALA
ncbi:hypothetical protein [Microbispora bryophytorum]|uniref:hypothetical protein n=1 Tax=Microbispora bryophytorum TaxID=1460882 RepID=UPI0034092C7E